MRSGNGVVRALAAVVVVLGIASTVAAEVVRIGDRPAPVRRKPDSESAVIATIAAATEVQVLMHDGDWLCVAAPHDAEGVTRIGWLDRHMVTSPPAAEPRPGGAAAIAAPAPSGSPASPLAAAAARVSPRAVVVHPPPAAAGSVAGSASPLAASAQAAQRGQVSASAARNPVRAALTANRADRSSAVEPPPPAGRVRAENGSIIGEWIVPRALRASVGANYQSANVAQAQSSLADRLLGGGATIVASFAILDPRIFTVDFAGDLQASRNTSEAALASFRNTSGMRSYRVDLGVLPGRRAPLRLFADRVASTSAMQPFGATLDPLRRTRGLHRGAGFTWDMDLDPALPHIQLSASTGRQVDERNYVFGHSSTNDERRAEIRANRDYRVARYDLDFTHGAYIYDVPEAGVRSDTGSDVFLATGRLAPSSRLTLDLQARGSRFRFGAGSQTSTVTGTGGDAAVRYQFPGHVAASARYSVSTNAFEAALSGRLNAGQPGATPVTSAEQLATRTLFHDGEGRVEYSDRRLTAAAVVKDVSFDVPDSQAVTLSALRTGGVVLHLQQQFGGTMLTAGADAAVGTAWSNQDRPQAYRDVGIQAGFSQDIAHVVRFGLDASARRVARLAFFPVNLETRTASLRLESARPGWARVRASLTYLDSLRDILLSDARDRHAGYGVGLAGPWYDLSADIDQTDTRSLLLAPGVLGARPEVAILIASRPGLFDNLLASTDRSRVFGAQLRPIAGLQLQGRLRRQEQTYPGLFGFRMNGGQAWASYQLREIQLELGWEYFDSWTSFGNVRDRRLYFRVRRDLVFF